ncbi:MAG: hypothetical protein IT370_27145 [Deltaproteobacteria bacterium]|nr:hypothetical protein [Deltaproteobacteria bacterium]
MSQLKGLFAVCVAALVGLGASARDAQACSCGRAQPSVWPRATDVAPVDTHVWISEPPLATRSDERAPLGLRVAGGALVPTTVRTMVSDEAAVSELVPRSALSPGRSYEVVYDRAAPGSKSADWQLLGSFRTGKAVDASAPSLGAAAVTRVSFVHSTARTQVVTVKGKKVIRIMQSTCDRNGAGYAVFEVAQASDDVTAPGSIGYGIWPAGSKDLSVAPLIILRGNVDTDAASAGSKGPAVVTLQLGTDHHCETSSYDFSADVARLVPASRGKRAAKAKPPALLHFTLAAIDGSGKRSLGIDVAIDLANPVQATP